MNLILEYSPMEMKFYTGQLINNKRTGFGIQRFPSGFVYTGNFHRDLPHGYGILDLPNIISYEGKFQVNIYFKYSNSIYECLIPMRIYILIIHRSIEENKFLYLPKV